MRPRWILSGDRREALAYEQGFKEGLRRAQELAKEHASASCCHECGECGGEGYVDNEDADTDDDCPQCSGKGEHIDKVAIDWTAADQAIDAEVAKERK